MADLFYQDDWATIIGKGGDVNMSVKFYDDGQANLYCGDSRAMTEIANETVQVVVTSPP